jgi:hypothetical protein
MQCVTAVSKIATTTQPELNGPLTVSAAVRSHASECPECSREIRVVLGTVATVYGGCPHLSSIEQRGDALTIMFTVPPRSGADLQ